MISVGFGMTELGGATHFPAIPGLPDSKEPSGSIGALLPNFECKVCWSSLHDTHNKSGERKEKDFTARCARECTGNGSPLPFS